MQILFNSNELYLVIHWMLLFGPVYSLAFALFPIHRSLVIVVSFFNSIDLLGWLVCLVVGWASFQYRARVDSTTEWLAEKQVHFPNGKQ